MESFSINGVVQAEYEYNALGQQVIRRLTQTGDVIHSVYDWSGNRIAEYDYDAATSTSTLIREYVWLNGRIVAVVEAGEVYYVRSDHIGRPVFATDGTGTKVWEASYLPFGGVHTSTGPTIDLRFPGQWFQSEAGLHQNWMRDYDPTLGRYIQADPLGLVDGASVYNYALQNPGRYVDPTGEAIPAAVWGAIRFATYVYVAFQLYCADDYEDYIRIILENLDPSRKVCPVCSAFRGKGKGWGPKGGGGSPMSPDQQALKELVDEATNGGRKPLSAADADTVLDWAAETKYPGWRAGPGDVGSPSNWVGGPHIHIPGVGSGHVPVKPGVRPRP